MNKKSSIDYMPGFTPHATVRAQVGKHQVSVGALSKILAEELGLDDTSCRLIAKAAALHDVGKLYISDSLNKKRGLYTETEMQIMQQHTLLGNYHLRAFRQTPMIKLAATIALEHHEKWDGTGYPFGLSGSQIAIESRIVSICDVYDALRENRPYRDGTSHEVAMEIIRFGDNRITSSSFDPTIVEAMINCQEHIRCAFDDHHKVPPATLLSEGHIRAA
jgi:putative two-component system response regulator